jgi:ABC-type transport system involved in multi-copper enzyme maturation permease subunit
MAAGDTWLNALIGAAVTVVTSFTVISPILGGAVAGYLNERDGLKAGALSGVIASIPLLGIVFLIGSVFVFLPFAGPGMMSGPGMLFGLAGVVIAVFVFVVVLLYGVALGALGGAIGQYVYEEDVL